jgi:ABC-2 type transport system permease protein
MIRRAILFNLLGRDAERTEFIWNPMNLESTSLAATGKKVAQDRPSRLLRLLPAAMAALFYVFLATSSNILLKSVSSEKENRTIEVILLSVSPKQLLVGKVVGLGIASLLQTMMWIAAFYVIMRINGYAFDLSDAARIPLSVLGWTLVFFSLGFAVYGSLMAGVGALVPKIKEANHASYVAIAPLIVAYAVALLAPLAGAANSWLPVVLSMFPLTAPVVMMMRVTTGEVPVWQLLVSVSLLMVTAYVIVTAVAAMFRAQYLLSGQPFSVVRFLRLMLGRG